MAIDPDPRPGERPLVDAGLSEVARFLAQHPPFTGLAAEELLRLVAETQIEFHAAGAAIVAENGEPVTFLRVIHSGAVDIAHHGRLLDLLGPGDTFGHAAMISGLPAGFEARAAEDTLCYRIPVAAARPLLDQARITDLRTDPQSPSLEPVGRLVRAPTLRCSPEQSISEVARRMTELGADCAIVELGAGGLGIVTDRDLRTRVLAAEIPATAPVAAVMTTPVFTVLPDRIGGEVLFELLERGVRHAPIVSATGQLMGVVSDGDLFAAQARPWFGARRAIEHASDLEALAAVADRLPKVLLDIHSSGLRALQVARVLSALQDALVIRTLDLCADERTGTGTVWLAVGTHARRELTPASITRGTFVLDAAPAASWLDRAPDALARCGVRRPPVVRTAEQWESRAGSDDMALAVLLDRRALWGTPGRALPLARGEHRDRLRRQLATSMVQYVVPTGFDEHALLDPAGRRSETFDIRQAVVAPIVALARWGGLVAGTTDGSTLERLAAAAAHDVFSDADARTLSDAFELTYQLRVDHQLEQIAAGQPPDEMLDPASLSGLTRSQLRDTFRAVTAVQRRLPPP
ncbi:MAG TPA: putative nucleotidyltransferase substrate binding domain-containing protein [Solirubrobacteraceae bacterium]|jgi:CBS domain-containing protein|nr:putative nucleotidyltransferase substrate binding domain-containing protein [Solirubrobacteraceae bacterium]